VTIAWNLTEIILTVTLGIVAGSLALIAFGLDSLVEVFASTVVLWHMASTDDNQRVGRDQLADRLVAIAFAILAVCLLIASTRGLWLADEADSSPVGIVYLAITALVMFTLARIKRRVGEVLESQPYLAEASMTLLDGWLATGILTALVLNTVLGWWWADPIAAFVVGIVAARKAHEGWGQRTTQGAVGDM
jgi:divalent metal cation (Fe/Co/Zn/Cd) transporter